MILGLEMINSFFFYYSPVDSTCHISQQNTVKAIKCMCLSASVDISYDDETLIDMSLRVFFLNINCALSCPVTEKPRAMTPLFDTLSDSCVV